MSPSRRRSIRDVSLRDRLRERELPQATVGIRIDWSEESYRLHRELDRQEQHLALAEAGNHADVDEVRARTNELRARIDSMYEMVTIRALPAADMERLLAEHPPTDEQRTQDPTVNFNRLTFFPALLAACVEGPETEQDWAEMIESGELVIGELNALIGTAMEINDRSPSVSLGKGSTTTRS